MTRRIDALKFGLEADNSVVEVFWHENASKAIDQALPWGVKNLVLT